MKSLFALATFLAAPAFAVAITTNITIRLDDSGSRTDQVYQALKFLRELEFGRMEAPAPYNQEIIQGSFFAHIEKLKPHILWGPSGLNAQFKRVKPYCKKNRLAYVWAPIHAMYLCPPAFSGDANEVSLLSLVETIMHETRHMHSHGHHHTSCNGGEENCDVSLSAKGAYAVSVEVSAKIGITATNVHPSMAFFARKNAHAIAMSSFAETSFNKLEAESLIFLTGTDGKRLAVNYRYQAPAFPFLPAGKIMDYSEAMPMFVPENPRDPILGVYGYIFDRQVLFEPDLAQPLPAYMSVTLERRKTLKGARLDYSTRGALRSEIWGDSISLVRLARKDKPVWQTEVQLPSGSPLLFRSPHPQEKEDAPGDQTIFYVLNDRDELFRLVFDYSTDQFSLERAENPFPGFLNVVYGEITDAQDAHDKQFAKWHAIKKNKGNEYPVPYPSPEYIVYLLDKQGQLYTQRGNRLAPFLRLQFKRFTAMAAGGNIYSQVPPALMQGNLSQKAVQ